MFNSSGLSRWVAGVALLTGINAAHAATLALSFSTTASGTTDYSATTNATTANSYTYGNTLANLSSSIGSSGYEFYDDYVFTVAGGSVSSVSSTISLNGILQIDNLQARLYSTTGNSPLPVLGTPAGTVYDATNTSYNVGSNTITIAALNDTPLAAGTYVLELRGNVSGSFGGSYSGVLNVAPVPLPGAALLMGSALLGIGARRRR